MERRSSSNENVNPSATEYDVAATAMSWAAGWAIARNKASPVNQPYGCSIELGDQLQRHVVARNDAAILCDLNGILRTPGTWLKVCAPADEVAPHLGEHWQIQPQEYLMAAGLNASAAGAHEGYALTLTRLPDITWAEYRDSKGELAARGCVAHRGGFGTFDQIVTEPAHQRKGLGRSVMAALGNACLAMEVSTGVLVATEQGRALYEALGWRLISPVTAAVVA